MKKLLIVLGFLVFLSIVLIFSIYNNPEQRFLLGTLTGLKEKPVLLDSNFSIQEEIVGINSSTAMIFIDNEIIFLEKETGQVRLISNGLIDNEVLWDFKVKKEGCECYTESGLLGITYDKPYVYIFVTEQMDLDETNSENRIYRFEWKDKKFVNQKLLNILPGYGNMHHGGAMVTDNNSNVYAVIGDQNEPGKLQNLPNGNTTDVGFILRVGIEPGVEIPSKSLNPYNHYYGIGIRNSFGLAIDPITNNLWITENGTFEYDEINLTFPNYNSGWKAILGPANNNLENLTELENFRYSDPEFSWEETVAPTGISFVDKTWKEYSNYIFVGDCSGNLYKFKLNESRNGFDFQDSSLRDLVLNKEDSNSEILLAKGFGCITDVEFNPIDKNLYIISYLNNGAIYKMKPVL